MKKTKVVKLLEKIERSLQTTAGIVEYSQFELATDETNGALLAEGYRNSAHLVRHEIEKIKESM